MVIENVRTDALEKPWGSHDLGPWSTSERNTHAIGELWFQRTGEGVAETSLLLKLLFTSQPLSIQVHPTDAFARARGLQRGKTEAWYILSAAEGSRVAVGLQRSLTKLQLREAIMNGSIVELLNWRSVAKDDVIFVPAGTIHAIGAGLVVVEVQQRSDTTFRLFDFGRGRDLDVDNAVECADAGPASHASMSRPLTDVRTLLVCNEYFVLELIDLPPFSNWSFFSETEAWIFALQGWACVGDIDAKAGEAVFVQMELAPIHVGGEGFRGLVAYADHRPSFHLLRETDADNRNSPAIDVLTNFALVEAVNSWVMAAGAER